MSAEQHRLLQALEHFNSRTKGGALPEGVQEAVQALQQALSGPMPGKDSPGAREALSVAPGTVGAQPISKAAKGVDGPSPGQREAKSSHTNNISQQIQEAAEAIAAANSK